jgi:putative ABC transport system substrate-binding protein
VASRIGVVLERFEARSPDELRLAFDAMEKRGIEAVMPAPGGFLYQQRAVLGKLALAKHLPMCVWSKEVLESGALISYGADYVDVVRRAAVLVDKILKGAKPAEIPVEQPTKFQLLVNLSTARTMGLTVPPIILARADEVIE